MDIDIETRAIIAWLESSAGQAWSRSVHAPIKPAAYLSVDDMTENDAA